MLPKIDSHGPAAWPASAELVDQPVASPQDAQTDRAAGAPRSLDEGAGGSSPVALRAFTSVPAAVFAIDARSATEPGAPPRGAEFGAKVQQWLQDHGHSDIVYDHDHVYGGDANLECTQYSNDVIYQATGFNLAQAVGRDMEAAQPGWSHLWPGSVNESGYTYPAVWTDTGSEAVRPGALLVDNWQTFFERQGVWHATDGVQPRTADNPMGAPSGMQPGDALLLRRDGGTHQALVKEIDAAGHPLRIVQSVSGPDPASAVNEKSWDDFQRSYQEQGFTLLGYGRPSDLPPDVLSQNTARPGAVTILTGG